MLTRTSYDRETALKAKKAAAREVMNQLVTHHPKLGDWCKHCAEATGNQVVALSEEMDDLLSHASELAEQILIGTMPIEWRGEQRTGWLSALLDKRDAAEMVLIPTQRKGAMLKADKTLSIVAQRAQKLIEWRKRLNAALDALDRHNPIMGYIVRLAVDDLLKRGTWRYNSNPRPYRDE